MSLASKIYSCGEHGLWRRYQNGKMEQCQTDPADPHKQTMDNLRKKGHVIGRSYIQSGADYGSGHLFAIIDGIGMPVEYASELDSGRMTLEQIKVALARQD